MVLNPDPILQPTACPPRVTPVGLPIPFSTTLASVHLYHPRKWSRIPPKSLWTRSCQPRQFWDLSLRWLPPPIIKISHHQVGPYCLRPQFGENYWALPTPPPPTIQEVMGPILLKQAWLPDPERWEKTRRHNTTCRRHQHLPRHTVQGYPHQLPQIIHLHQVRLWTQNQQGEKKCRRITARGNCIIYPGNVGTKTGSLEKFKLVANSVISLPGAWFSRFEIKSFTSKLIPPTLNTLASKSPTSLKNLFKNIICSSTSMAFGYTCRSAKAYMSYPRLACLPTSF